MNIKPISYIRWFEEIEIGDIPIQRHSPVSRRRTSIYEDIRL